MPSAFATARPPWRQPPGSAQAEQWLAFDRTGLGYSGAPCAADQSRRGGGLPGSMGCGRRPSSRRKKLRMGWRHVMRGPAHCMTTLTCLVMARPDVSDKAGAVHDRLSILLVAPRHGPEGGLQARAETGLFQQVLEVHLDRGFGDESWPRFIRISSARPTDAISPGNAAQHTCALHLVWRTSSIETTPHERRLRAPPPPFY